jgi:hypothetical protein
MFPPGENRGCQAGGAGSDNNNVTAQLEKIHHSSVHCRRLPLFYSGFVVANYAVQPGARVVWCMKRRTTDVRCVLLSTGMPVEVQVVHGRDIVVTEMFQEEWMAMNWARAYQERLRVQGWNDVPEEPAS